MRETYEYAVVDVESFKTCPSPTSPIDSSGSIEHYKQFDTAHLTSVLNDLGKDGFRIVTILEEPNSKLILMSKAVSK